MAVRQAQLRGLALREALGRRRVLRLEALLDVSDGGCGDPDSQIERIHAYPHSDSDLQLERVLRYFGEVGYYSEGTSDIDSNGILNVSAEDTGTVESEKGTITDGKGHLAEETLDIDFNGILNVSAEDTSTAEIEKGTITNDKGHLTEEEHLEKMIKEAAQFGDDDKSVKESVGGKSAFEQAGMKITMNVDNLEDAYTYEQLPSDDLGMTRLEAVVRDAIGVHPKALLNYGSLDASAKALVERKVLGYASPREFYVHKIVGEVAAIAVSVYPKRLIVQVSDYSSNGYKNLIGGDLFEPDEENPMIDFRGSGRYTDPFFQECFDMELEAVRKIRGEMGLTNIEIMIPSVRTLDMVKDVRAVLGRSGLKYGEDGLTVNMMTGLLGNAFLAEELLEYVDGFYIGSNDLTQLYLGVDCESGLVAQSFDECSPADMKGLELLIKAAKTKGKSVGICCRGPSNHPNLAKGFMEQGTDPVSLTSRLPGNDFLAEEFPEYADGFAIDNNDLTQIFRGRAQTPLHAEGGGKKVGRDGGEEPRKQFRTWADWKKWITAGRTREQVRAEAENAWLQRLDASGLRPASCAGLSWGKGRGG